MVSRLRDDRHCSGHRYHSNSTLVVREIADVAGEVRGHSHLAVFVRRRFVDYNTPSSINCAERGCACVHFIAAGIND